MKTIKTKVLVVVFMLVTLVNYANNTNFNNALDAKKVKVVFKDAKKGHQLTIKDSDGIALHSENVTKKGNLVKIFNFSKLENGNYTLELEKDFEIVIKSMKINGNTVTFDENAKKTIFKPVIRNKENRLIITKISFDKKPLQVSLYFNNEIIYSETVKGDSILNRVYRLDEEKKGNYRVVLHNNGRSYVNEFKI